MNRYRIRDIEVGDKVKTIDGKIVELTKYMFGFSNGEDVSFYIFSDNVKGNSNFIQGKDNLSKYLIEVVEKDDKEVE